MKCPELLPMAVQYHCHVSPPISLDHGIYPLSQNYSIGRKVDPPPFPILDENSPIGLVLIKKFKQCILIAKFVKASSLK